MSTITKKFWVDDVLTNMTSVKLSSFDETYGVKRNDTDAVVVADGTDMTNSATGIYTYEFDDPANDLTYTYVVEYVYAGETYHITDTMTGPAAGAGADLTNGYLYRGLMLLREILDEPDALSKYSDSRLIGFLETAYGEVLAEHNRVASSPVVSRYDVTLAGITAEQFYELPPTMGTIISMTLLDTNGDRLGHLNPQHITNPAGQNYRLDGNTLWVKADAFTAGYTIRFYYVTTGAPQLHDGTAAAITAGTITLAVTPVRGTRDARPNAYAGAVVRILGADDNYVMQERYISAYDAQTRVATVKPDFDPLPGGTVNYEIGPLLGRVFDQVMVFRAAMTMCALEPSVSNTKYKALTAEFQRRLRCIRLSAAQKDLYEGLSFRKDTALYGTP